MAFFKCGFASKLVKSSKRQFFEISSDVSEKQRTDESYVIINIHFYEQIKVVADHYRCSSIDSILYIVIDQLSLYIVAFCLIHDATGLSVE